MKKHFDWQRFTRLAKFDYTQRKGFYWGHIPLIFAVISLLHIAGWNLLQFPVDYISTNGLKPLFGLGFVLLTFVIAAGSFREFGKKETSLQYLMIPASTFEKILLKLLVGIVPVTIFYPIIYDVAVGFAVGVTQLIQENIFQRAVRIEPYVPIIKWGEVSVHGAELPWWGSISLISSWLFFPVYFYTAGLLFPKRPRIYGFLTLLAIAFVLVNFIGWFSSGLNIPFPFLFISSDLENPSAVSSSGSVMLAFFCLSIPTMLALSYFKLKEKEV